MPRLMLITPMVLICAIDGIAGESQAGLKLTIKPLAKTTVASGLLDVAVILDNKTNDSLKVVDSRGLYVDYEIKATYKDGTAVPATAFRRNLDEAGSSVMRDLLLGEKCVWVLCLSRVFDLTMEGDYNFRIKRHGVFDKNNKPLVVEGECKISVVGRRLGEGSPEMDEALKLAGLEKVKEEKRAVHRKDEQEEDK